MKSSSYVDVLMASIMSMPVVAIMSMLMVGIRSMLVVSIRSMLMVASRACAREACASKTTLDKSAGGSTEKFNFEDKGAYIF